MNKHLMNGLETTSHLADLSPRTVRARTRVVVSWSRRVVVCLGVVAGVFFALCACLAGNFSNILFNQIRDAYLLYRVTNERDALEASLKRVQGEVVGLRLEQSKGQLLEEQVQVQLEALRDVVSLAGSLGLIERGSAVNSKGSLSPAGQGPELNTRAKKKKEVARATQQPAAQDARNSNRQVTALHKGLGGAEVECTPGTTGTDECASALSKEEVALLDERITDMSLSSKSLDLKEAKGASPVDGKLVTLQRLLAVTQALRLLPIGSPVAGEFTSGFGHRHSPFSHRSSFHEGVDISLPRGGVVVATADGLVAKVDFDGTYGWMVDVEHTPNLVTRYAHLSRILVREGAKIERGTKLALSGSTGRSTGPHLHYEVRYKNVARNPRPFLALADKLKSFS